MASEKKPGVIRRFFSWIWNFVKKHPLITLVIVVIVAVAGLFVTYEALHLTSDPKFCRMCHPEEGTGPLSEYHTWDQNIHSYSNVECLDCHRPQPGAWGYMRAKVQDGLYDLVMEFVLSDEKKLAKLSEFEGNPDRSAHSVTAQMCMHCHSDSVNEENREQHWMTFGGVAMGMIDTVENPGFREIHNLINLDEDEVRSGVAASHSLHLALDLRCADCHEAVSHSGDFISKLDMQTCFDCHDQQRAEGGAPVENDDCESCHINQVAIQTGTAHYGPVTEELMAWMAEYSSAPQEEPMEWSMNLGCESCHVDAFDISTVVNSCLDCHGDEFGDTAEDYQGLIEGYQADYEALNDEALAFILQHMPEREKMSATRLALFNQYEVLYKKVAKDHSRGFHNPEYITYLFDTLAKMRQDFDRAPR